MEYELIRSKRKTLAIQVMPGGNLRVRAPEHMPKTEIECFLSNKKDWIFQKQKEQKERILPVYSKEQKKDMCIEAENKIKPRVDFYAAKMGVTPKSISVTEAQKQWGSCSSDGRLHFSFRLAQSSLEQIDYVVVHELAHIIEFNHSKAFWQKVKEILPDYEERRKSLRSY